MRGLWKCILSSNVKEVLIMNSSSCLMYGRKLGGSEYEKWIEDSSFRDHNLGHRAFYIPIP